MRNPFLAAGLLLAGIFGAGAAQEPTPGKRDAAALRRLVEDLNSEDFEVRTKAQKALAQLDEAPAALREAAKSADEEVRGRALLALEAIRARADAKEIKGLVPQLAKIEMERLVDLLVGKEDGAEDPHWDLVQGLAKVVLARANELGGKNFKAPELHVKMLPVAKYRANDSVDFQGKRVVVDQAKANILVLDRCVLLSKEALPRVANVRHSLLVINGDFAGAVTMQDCLVIVRGNIGPITNVSNSVLLATGECQGGTSADQCLFQVKNQNITFTAGRHNVFINCQGQSINADRNSKVLETERGPLQLLKFSADKKKETAK